MNQVKTYLRRPNMTMILKLLLFLASLNLLYWLLAVACKPQLQRVCVLVQSLKRRVGRLCR